MWTLNTDHFVNPINEISTICRSGSTGLIMDHKKSIVFNCSNSDLKSFSISLSNELLPELTEIEFVFEYRGTTMSTIQHTNPIIFLDKQYWIVIVNLFWSFRWDINEIPIYFGDKNGFSFKRSKSVTNKSLNWK